MSSVDFLVCAKAAVFSKGALNEGTFSGNVTDEDDKSASFCEDAFPSDRSKSLLGVVFAYEEDNFVEFSEDAFTRCSVVVAYSC